MTTEISRRSLLSKVLIASGAALTGSKALAQSCGLTPEQSEGPFYPIQDQDDKNNDLTRVKGKLISATGQIAILSGIVQDDTCRPVKGAMVEIWQACHTGKYNHPSDPNPAKLDPNFQYWGQAITNEKGEYSFKTIVPGAYPADNTWIRPPHIHFKVHLRGYEELTSQLYWKGHPLNKKDRILQSLPKEERERVIVDFKDVNGTQYGIFNISLKSF
jgi:protocatechuate 3,4-dioxygenase, beta subunit